MAIASEISSLNDINYKSRFRVFLLGALGMFLFSMAFINYYPIGDRVKGLVKATLPRGCSPDYQDFRIEWLLPKIVVTDLVIPPGCLQGATSALSFSHVTINWHFISFAPIGIPFRIDTEFSGQQISLYFVQGFGEQKLRLKDQSLRLSNFREFLGGKDFGGSIVVDMGLSLVNGNMDNLTLKARSKDLVVPSMNLQGLTTPSLNINDFYLEAASAKPPRIVIDKILIGDTNSEIRASFKGKMDLQQGNINMSPLDLTGEMAFSESFLKKFPVDTLFGSFTQKDGFYQIKIDGTVGQPVPSPL